MRERLTGIEALTSGLVNRTPFADRRLCLKHELTLPRKRRRKRHEIGIGLPRS